MEMRAGRQAGGQADRLAGLAWPERRIESSVSQRNATTTARQTTTEAEADVDDEGDLDSSSSSSSHSILVITQLHRSKTETDRNRNSNNRIRNRDCDRIAPASAQWLHQVRMPRANNRGLIPLRPQYSASLIIPPSPPQCAITGPPPGLSPPHSSSSPPLPPHFLPGRLTRGTGHRYARSFLLKLAGSPFVPAVPDEMPALAEWFG